MKIVAEQLFHLFHFVLKKGEVLSRDEAVNVFMGITKLFSSRNGHLRCLVYLGIKELADYAQDVCIAAVAPLMHDIAHKRFRGPAIRALTAVIDVHTVFIPILSLHYLLYTSRVA